MGERDRFRLDEFELYRSAREFRKRIYRLARGLPGPEEYCLGIQLRRAAISVTNNIAEGHGRWHFQDNIRFCRISRGSVEEIIDDLNVCEDEGYAEPALINELRSEAYQLIERINSYIGYLRKSKRAMEE